MSAWFEDVPLTQTPTKEEVENLLAEMDRRKVLRGWVLACALKRAMRGQRP